MQRPIDEHTKNWPSPHGYVVRPVKKKRGSNFTKSRKKRSNHEHHFTTGTGGNMSHSPKQRMTKLLKEMTGVTVQNDPWKGNCNRSNSGWHSCAHYISMRIRRA